jgi:hypothetical protein
MHASIACLLLYEDHHVWVSLGNAMKAKQSKGRILPSGALSALGSLHSAAVLITATLTRDIGIVTPVCVRVRVCAVPCPLPGVRTRRPKPFMPPVAVAHIKP